MEGITETGKKLQSSLFPKPDNLDMASYSSSQVILPVRQLSPSPTSDNKRPGIPPTNPKSDTPLGFSAIIQSSPQLIPISSRRALEKSVSMKENSKVEKPTQFVKQASERKKEGMGDCKSGGEVVNDLLNSYMNLDNIDLLNSSGTEDKDLDSRASETKTNEGENSDDEVESCLNGNPEKREGIKIVAGGDIASPTRHYRSFSMDSYMGSFLFGEESLKLSPSKTQNSQQSPVNLADGNLPNGEFTKSELKKIMANEKLAEIALSDPKRVKRILANRQSAARSKERKMQYVAELEQKVHTLQSEVTSLSAQLTLLQGDSAGFTSQNNELKFHLQAMEQEAQLKDALNEALATEVQRLKLATAEFTGKAHLSNCMAQQLSINHQLFQLCQLHDKRQCQQHNGDSNMHDRE